MGGQSDAGGDLHGQEHCDGEHLEPHADLPGHQRADLVRQTAPQDRQQQQAEQQLAAYPGHGRQDVEDGQTVKVAFTAPGPGTFQFHCKYHPKQMVEMVTIT